MLLEYTQKDQKHFTSWAPHFDKGIGGVFFRASYRRLLRLFVPRAGARVLEIACGTGGFMRALLDASPGISLTGIDYTRVMLAQAENKFKNDPRVRLLCTPAEELRVEGPFEYVYCVDAFHHFQDADKALEEMRRVMAPSGRAVILDPIFDGWRAPLMACALPLFGEAYIFKRTTEDWHALIAEHKFKITQETYWLYFFKIFVLENI